MIRKPVKEKTRRKLAKYLSSDEDIVFVTSIGNRYFWSKLISLFPLAIILIGLPKFSHLVRKKQSLTYVLTNRRFLIISGIFSRKITTAPLDRITHVTVEQSFFDRYFYNSGNLVVITAGFDQREIVIENIGDPIRFKIMMEELTHKLESAATDHEYTLRSL